MISTHITDRSNPMGLQGDQGFTLLEIVITLAVASLLMVGVIQTFNKLNKSYTIEQVSAEVLNDANASLTFLSRGLIMAGFDPSGDAGAGFRQADAQTVRFTQDLWDSSGNVSGAIETNTTREEDILYRFVAADASGSARLERVLNLGSADEVVQTVVTDIDLANCSFTYFGDRGVQIAAPVPQPPTAATIKNTDDIRSVGITIQLTRSAGGSSTATRTLSKTVTLRNQTLQG